MHEAAVLASEPSPQVLGRQPHSLPVRKHMALLKFTNPKVTVCQPHFIRGTLLGSA